MEWHVYIIRCGDNTLYTGIAKDIDRRFQAHVAGEGAKYTRNRGPLTIVYRETVASHGDALRREIAIKKMWKNEKEELIARAGCQTK